MKKYIIILVVVLLLIGGVWIYSALKNKNQLNSSQDFNDKGFIVSQNGKSVSGQYISDTSSLDLGLAAYPNATIIADKDAAEKLNLQGVKLTAATYTTSDARDKVETYYKSKIGTDAIIVEAVDGAQTYRLVKSKNNIGSSVNVWVQDKVTYFTIIKPAS